MKKQCRLCGAKRGYLYWGVCDHCAQGVIEIAIDEKNALQGVVELDPNELRPAGVAPRIHRRSFETLTSAMRRYGQVGPVHVIPPHEVVDGWMRVLAARELGIKVKAVYVDEPPHCGLAASHALGICKCFVKPSPEDAT